MGLPRYQKGELRVFWANCTKTKLFIVGLNIARRATFPDMIDKVIEAGEKANLSEDQQVQATLKWGWRHQYAREAVQDELKRATARLYVGLEREEANASWER